MTGKQAAERRAERRAAGVCVACGTPRQGPKYLQCNRCRAMAAKRALRWVYRRLGKAA